MTHHIIPVVVREIVQVTPLIKQFTLTRTDGSELPAFSAGSHIIVVLRRKDRTFRNPYSLQSSPRDTTRYQIAVRRHEDGRGGSRFLHQDILVGEQLEISHPVNLFPLIRLARRHIFIAGGVGITPVLAMIAELRDGTVPWELHYAYRGKEHDYYGRLLAQQSGEHIHLYDTSEGSRPNFARILADLPLGTHVYTCGPQEMIDSVAQSARTAGWPTSHIHSEQFSTPPSGEAFDVYLARSEISLRVTPERSLLEAMEAVGITAPYMCRGGVCGECETDVLELQGELIHNDHWLSQADKSAGRKIMPCVSRARCVRLVLDR